MADQPTEQTSALYNTTMQQRNHHHQQPRQDKGLLHVEVPSGGCSQSSSSSSPTSLPSLKDQLLANEQAQQQDYTALRQSTEWHDLEQQERGSPSLQNVVVGAVEIEQSLNDTVLPATATAAATSRRSSRRRRRGSSNSNGQRALTTESHPFFDGTLEALIQQAERDDDMDDSALLASMDRLRVVDTSIRRTTRRGGRRPARRNGGRAARSA